MKLSKKIMLFEEFAQVKSNEVSSAKPVAAIDIDKSQIRTEIVNDVDSIISKLEDLANNLGDNKVGITNESEGMISEGAADQLMSAELYMLPLVAMGLVGGSALGLGVAIKKALKRKKIRKLFSKEIEKPRIAAAKLKIQKAKEEGDAKKKTEAKIKDLEAGASEMQTRLGEKYPDSKDLLAALNADLNFKISSVLIKSGVLTPSELEKAEQTQANAQEAIQRTVDNSTKEVQNAKDKVKNATPEEKNEIKTTAEKAAEKMSAEQEEKNSKEGQLKRLGALLKKAEERGDEEKIKKYKEQISKVATKESWDPNGDEESLFESQILMLELELM